MDVQKILSSTVHEAPNNSSDQKKMKIVYWEQQFTCYKPCKMPEKSHVDCVSTLQIVNNFCCYTAIMNKIKLYICVSDHFTLLSSKLELQILLTVDFITSQLYEFEGSSRQYIPIANGLLWLSPV